MKKSIKAEDIELVPFQKLKDSIKKVLSKSKRESDLEILAMQAANVKRRAAKKKAA